MVHAAECDLEAQAPLWLRLSSLLLILVALALFALVLGNRIYDPTLSSLVLTFVLVALASTGFLHTRAWFEERKRIYATESEFTSIYQHVLDGIVILDDRGVCLDANPAAFAILGTSRALLVGHSFGQFCKEPRRFEQEWRVFLEQSCRRGRAELVRRNGSEVVVHFTAAAHYLPGRHVLILCDVTERVEAEHLARENHHLYQQMADNIDEVFWLVDLSTKKVIAVNRAYETLTGRPLGSIERDPSSYKDLIHSDDRVHVLAKLEAAVHSGRFDEEFRIVRPDGEIRWLWAKAAPAATSGPVIRHFYGTAQDITARKLADAQVAEHLIAAAGARAEAERANAEAEALRKATLALTRDLRMDAVLDTLLETLFEIVPYETASVILSEENERLFVAREAPPSPVHRPVITVETSDTAFLQRILLRRKGLHLADTREEPEWRAHKAFARVRSWIAVPLVVSDSVLGLLSIGNPRPRAFTTHHFRLAKLLAIPAAVAIHNARLYEWAQIYAAERQTLLKKLGETSKLTDQDSGPSRQRLTN